MTRCALIPKMNDADIAAFFRDDRAIEAEISAWQILATAVARDMKLPPFKGISQGKKH